MNNESQLQKNNWPHRAHLLQLTIRFVISPPVPSRSIGLSILSTVLWIMGTVTRVGMLIMRLGMLVVMLRNLIMLLLLLLLPPAM